MDFDRCLLELGRDRKKGIPWLEIADRLRRMERDGTWRTAYPSRVGWLNAVKRFVEYSPSMVQKLIEAHEFVSTLADEITDEKLRRDFREATKSVIGVAAIGFLKRIHDIAPSEVHKNLRNIVSGTVRVRQLEEDYARLVRTNSSRSVSTAKLGSRAAADFVPRALTAVERNLPRLSGKHARIFRKQYKLRLVDVDGVAISISGHVVNFVDGFEARFLTGLPSPFMKKRILADLAWAANFFRRYWVILPANSTVAAELDKELSALGHNSIGVAELARAGELDIKRRPTPSSKGGGNQAITKREIISQGIPGL